MRYLILTFLCIIHTQSYSQVVYVQDLFLEAVLKGDLEKATEYANAGISVNVESPNYTGTTALIMAIKNNDEQMVQFLLDKGGDVLYSPGVIPGDIRGYYTPFKCAAYRGNIKILELLMPAVLKKGINNSAYAIQKTYDMVIEQDNKKSIAWFEQSLYVVPKKELLDSTLNPERIQIYQNIYPEFTQKSLDKAMKDTTHYLFSEDKIRYDLLYDRGFVTYLKDHLNLNIPLPSLDEWLVTTSSSRQNIATPSLESAEFMINTYQIKIDQKKLKVVKAILSRPISCSDSVSKSQIQVLKLLFSHGYDPNWIPAVEPPNDPCAIQAERYLALITPEMRKIPELLFSMTNSLVMTCVEPLACALEFIRKEQQKQDE